MAIPSTAELVAVLRQYHLLETAQLTETAALAHSFPEPRALADALIRRGWLTPFQVEQIFLGKSQELALGAYVLLERLGEDGMGAVFKAKNWQRQQVVALKLIRKERLAQPEAVPQFRRETQAAAQLNHPNIVRALEADEIEGTHLLVMEFIGGIDLARLVKERGPLPVVLACDYLRQAALGLQHAFERGILHHDLKPSNLLVTSSYTPVVGGLRQADPPTALGTRLPAPDPLPGFRPGGLVKILNMGLARLAGTAADNLNSLAARTPDFLAPEQAQESKLGDIRADLYSLGCTFYYLLTGRVPFPSGEARQNLLKHHQVEPEPVEKLRPEVPPEIAAVVRKLMAQKAEDRHQTPAEVATALAAGGEQVPAAAARCERTA